MHAVTGKAVIVWRRQSDGNWKCVADIWNGNPTEQVFIGPQTR